MRVVYCMYSCCFFFFVRHVLFTCICGYRVRFVQLYTRHGLCNYALGGRMDGETSLRSTPSHKNIVIETGSASCLLRTAALVCYLQAVRRYAQQSRRRWTAVFAVKISVEIRFSCADEIFSRRR